MKRAFSGTWLVGALLAASAAISSSPVAAANLLVNPGFETGGGSYTGWTTFGNGAQLSLPAGDNIIRTGAAASKLFGEFTGCPSAKGFTVGGCFQAFTPTAGKLYTMSGYSFVSLADPIPGTTTCTKNRAIAKISFYNAAVGGAEMSSNEVVIGDGNSVTNQWNAFTVSAPAPAGALRVEALLLFLQPGCDTGSTYIDDTSFDESTPAVQPNVLVNPSFDANLSGWTTFGNVTRDVRAGSFRTPAGSANMFSTFSPDTPSGMFQSTAATAGSVWQLDAYAMTSCLYNDAITGANDNYVTAKVVFRDLANTELGSNQTVILDNTSPLGNWTAHTVSAVAPAGTTTAQAYLLFFSPTLQGGSMWVDDINFQNLGLVGVAPGAGARGVELAQNAPNPFGSNTRIDFVLAEPGAVDLVVYNIAGRRIATLVHGRMDAGPHSVTWNGKTANQVAAAPGMYQYVLKTSAGQSSRRMLLIP